jgi:hypothetical protein
MIAPMMRGWSIAAKIRDARRLASRLPHLLATLALTAHLLVPMHALAAYVADPEDGRVPICTAQGLVWVSLDEPAASKGTGSGLPFDTDHACQYCAAHAKPWALAARASIPLNMLLPGIAESPSYRETAPHAAPSQRHGIRAPPA